MSKPHFAPTLEAPSFDLVLFASRFSFVATEALLPEMSAVTKSDAIRQMVAALASVDAVPSELEVELFSSVMRREQLGTTGIGGGIAIPHAKHPEIDRVVATIAFCPQGVDFDSLDGRNAHLIFLVLSAVHGTAENLRALQQIAMEVRNASEQGTLWKIESETRKLKR